MSYVLCPRTAGGLGVATCAPPLPPGVSAGSGGKVDLRIADFSRLERWADARLGRVDLSGAALQRLMAEQDQGAGKPGSRVSLRSVATS